MQNGMNKSIKIICLTIALLFVSGCELEKYSPIYVYTTSKTNVSLTLVRTIEQKAVIVIKDGVPYVVLLD